MTSLDPDFVFFSNFQKYYRGIRVFAFWITFATTLLYAPAASACSLNPTAVISAPAAASSHIHGTVVSFNGSTSTANCGTIIGYLWKNGSTTLSTSRTFNYTVTLAPEQVDSVITVSLKVTSSHNARTHTIYRTITIKRDHQSQYFVKDHLGSPRVVVDGKGAVLSYTDYYPFGMVMPGRAGNISLSNDRVKFTGYLLEEEGDQDTYHAEARGYDPVIGRFTSRDPMAHLYPGHTPYHYALNNPVIYKDPNGKWVVTAQLTFRSAFIISGAVSAGVAIDKHGNFGLTTTANIGAGPAIGVAGGLEFSLFPAAQNIDELGGLGVTAGGFIGILGDFISGELNVALMGDDYRLGGSASGIPLTGSGAGIGLFGELTYTNVSSSVRFNIAELFSEVTLDKNNSAVKQVQSHLRITSTEAIQLLEMLYLLYDNTQDELREEN